MAIDRDGDGPPMHRDDNKPRTEARDDLRATPFTDDVFDDDYYGRKRRGSGKGRSISLVVGLVLGLVIVGGIGWYAFKGGGLALMPGEPQTVQADPTPYKIKPENPGGMQVENQDKLVYDRVAKGAAPNRVENLLPPAEEPKAPPQRPQVNADDKKALQEIVKAAAEEPVKAPAPPATAPAKAVEPVKAEPPKVETAKAEPAKVEAAKPDPLVAAVAAVQNKPVADAPPASAPPAAPVQTAALTPAPSAQSGAFQVQLVSVPSEEAAKTEWARLNKKHKDLFANLSPAVTKAELADKGTVYRLRAGPLADKAAAETLCAALAAEKTGCIIVKP